MFVLLLENMTKICSTKLMHTTKVTQMGGKQTEPDRHKWNEKRKGESVGKSGQRVFLLLCLLHTAFFLILAAFCTLWQAGGQALGRDKVSGYGSTKKQEGEEEEIKKVNKRR